MGTSPLTRLCGSSTTGQGPPLAITDRIPNCLVSLASCGPRRLITTMATPGHSVWFNKGTIKFCPHSVRRCPWFSSIRQGLGVHPSWPWTTWLNGIRARAPIKKKKKKSVPRTKGEPAKSLSTKSETLSVAELCGVGLKGLICAIGK